MRSAFIIDVDCRRPARTPCTDGACLSVPGCDPPVARPLIVGTTRSRR